uniref:Uncharacterized protein n=1 Tax=Arundo donax TaxID=35708 RepID=A0A0A8XQ41_ARUDO
MEQIYVIRHISFAKEATEETTLAAKTSGFTLFRLGCTTVARSEPLGSHAESHAAYRF